MANEFSRKRVAKATYSFAVDGGAVSTITPATTEIVPTGAIITNVILHPSVVNTSGGAATLVINAGGVVVSGTTPWVYSAAPFDATVPTPVTKVGAVATAQYIPTVATSSGKITVTVAGAALTAGAFDIYVEYMDSL